MDLSYDDVQKILKIIDGSSVEELHLEIGDLKLVVRKRGATAEATEFRPAAATLPPAPRPQAAAAPGEQATTPPVPPSSRRPQIAGVEVKAPMVGTFYRSPAPGAPPFVEVGSLIDADATVCIIEVMKLMNSIEAGVRGTVREIFVANGTAVDAGEVLMAIEPRP